MLLLLVQIVLLTLLGAPALFAFYKILLPYIKSLPQRRKLRNLPGPPPRVFLLGNVPDLLKAPVHQVVAQWAEKYGKIFKVELPVAAAVVVTDPDAVTQMLKVDKYDKYIMSYKHMEQVTAEDHPSMLTVKMGPYYRAIRRAITPAFSTANLRQFMPTLLQLTDRVMRYLTEVGPEMPVDMDAVAQRLTIDVIGHFAFDRDFGATAFGDNEALRVVGELLVAMQRMMNPLNRWCWWRKEALALRAARMRFDALVRGVLKDLRIRPPAPHCLAAHLAALQHPETGKPLPPQQLRAETALFWIAGFETTAHAIGWTLMFIAADAEVQACLAAELDAMGLLARPGGPPPRPLVWADLGGMRYLNALINESLRLMPPASGGTAV